MPLCSLDQTICRHMRQTAGRQVTEHISIPWGVPRNYLVRKHQNKFTLWHIFACGEITVQSFLTVTLICTHKHWSETWRLQLISTHS